VLPTQTFIYNDHKDPKLITTIETCYNEKGLIAVASFNKEYSHGIIIALPGKVQGEIQILTLQSNVNNNNNNSNSSTSNLSSFNSLISRIKAHKSSLACLSISLNGELIASASELGTLIRVFNVETRQKTNEFRRGMDKAQIYCINFNKYLNKICVSSNKGTIHIFDLDGKYKYIYILYMNININISIKINININININILTSFFFFFFFFFLIKNFY